jgi:hypothetical protein
MIKENHDKNELITSGVIILNFELFDYNKLYNNGQRTEYTVL